MSFFKLGIMIASVDYRKTAVFGNEQSRCGDFRGELGGEFCAKLGAIMIKH